MRADNFGLPRRLYRCVLRNMNNALKPENIVPLDFDRCRRGENKLWGSADVAALLERLPGYEPRWRRRCFYYPTHKRILMIVESEEVSDEWVFYCGTILIRRGFSSADDAADWAHRYRKDSEQLKGLYVPPDLAPWTKWRGGL